MGNDSRLRIIIDASTDNAKAALGTIAGDLRATGVAAEEAGMGLTGLAEGSAVTAGALTGVAESGAVAAAGMEGLTVAGAGLAESEVAATFATAALSESEISAALAADAAATAEAGAGVAAEEMAVSSSLAKDAMKGLAGGAIAVGIGLAATKAAYDTVIGSTLSYADNIRTLQRNIGATAEESSKLIQAADDAQISFETLNAGMQAAVRKGFTPTIEGLGELADRYVALEDPIAQDKFLMDTFGRSGAELAQLMALGSVGIKEFGDRALTTGQVMSQDAVNATHDWEMALDGLGDAIQGVEVKLTGKLIPALTTYVNGIGKQEEAVALGIEAIQKGIITDNEWNIIRANAETGVRTYAQSIADLKVKVDAYNLAGLEGNIVLQNQIHQHSEANVSLTTLTGAYGHQLTTEEQVNQAIDHNLAQVAKQIQADKDLADSIRDAADQESALAAGLGGEVAKNQGLYRTAIANTTPEIIRLTAEIAKYTGWQGQAYSIVTDAKYSQDEYSLAVLKGGAAQQAYTDYLGASAEKLQKLSDASGNSADDLQAYTDYVGASALKTLELKVAAEHAGESVDKMGKDMGSTVTGVADYTTAIGKDQVALDALTQAQKDAEAQLKLTNGQFLFQQVSMYLTPAAALEAARGLGIIDEASYTAGLSALALTTTWDLNKNGMIDNGKEADGFARSITGVQTAMDKTAVAGPPLDASLASNSAKMHDQITANDGVASSFDGVIKGADDYAAALGNIPTAVTTQVSAFYTQYGAGGPGYLPTVPGLAGGGSVSAGMPYWVGEHGPELFSPNQDGAIIPHGSAAAGDTYYNVTINDKLAAALFMEQVRQRNLARANALMD